MRYSLADYILAISSNDKKFATLFKDVRIGGEGDALASISIQQADQLWTTDSYATGAWVHNKNLSRVGTCDISISQLTDAVAKFKMFVNLFYGDNTASTSHSDGITMTLSDSRGNNIVTCTDCYPTQIPTQEFGKTAADQTWSFTCGKITFN
jgi:hypothetical protein